MSDERCLPVWAWAIAVVLTVVVSVVNTVVCAGCRAFDDPRWRNE